MSTLRVETPTSSIAFKKGKTSAYILPEIAPDSICKSGFPRRLVIHDGNRSSGAWTCGGRPMALDFALDQLKQMLKDKENDSVFEFDGGEFL